MEEGGIGSGFARRDLGATRSRYLNDLLGSDAVASGLEPPQQARLNLQDIMTQDRRDPFDLHNLQLSGGGQSFENRGASGIGIGGRVGYALPIGTSKDATVGLSGGWNKVKVNTPDGPKHLHSAALSGLDASYGDDQTRYGLELGLGPEKRLMLRYRGTF